MPTKELTPEDRHRCMVIHDLIVTRELKVTELAEAAGISARWLIYIRQGRAAPSFAVCKKLAHAIGVPVGHITSDAFRPEVMATADAKDAA